MRRLSYPRSGFGLGLALAAFSINPASADEMLPPHTRLKIDVVQWSPFKGAFEEWAALGGQFAISEARTIATPLVGTVSTEGLDAETLGRKLAEELKLKAGLVSAPVVSVQVVEYPPIYVMGDVVKPGEYPFRRGLTVLQALALGGGEKMATIEDARERETAANDLKNSESRILLARARIARLEAERDGQNEIVFPAMRSSILSTGQVAEVFDREQLIFEARRKELQRQEASLNELRDLLRAEIDVLQQKIATTDRSIATAQKELAAVSELVEKGVVVASRRSDLERLLASLQSSRLDHITAMMRARQNIAGANRDRDGLVDKFQTAVAAELQQEQSELDSQLLKRDMAMRMLAEMPPESPSASLSAPIYTIIRSGSGGQQEIAADPATELRPGDVLRLRREPVEGEPIQSKDDAAALAGPVREARRIAR